MIQGARRTLAEFRSWQERNPEAIAGHVDRYTRHIDGLPSRHPLRVRLRRLGARAAEHARIEREVRHFVIYNLLEVPTDERIALITEGLSRYVPEFRVVERTVRTGGLEAAVDLVRARLNGRAGDLPELLWLRERLRRLHRVLPADVLRAGAMGKVSRTIGGVLAIAVYDTFDVSADEAADHLRRVVRGGYALGAAYAIIDDCLHDLPEHRLPRAEREDYHRLVLRALPSGEPLCPSQLPDNPLAEELCAMREQVLTDFPPATHGHLYRAGTCMYLAQHRDASRAHPDLADVFIKAGLSRVIANIMGRRSLPDGFYARCLNTIMLSQLRDDLKDREEDAAAGRCTLFTLPPEEVAGDPLYDVFAYEAYVVDGVFDGDERVADDLAYHGAGSIAAYLAQDPAQAAELERAYPPTPEIRRFLRVAAGLHPRVAAHQLPVDKRLRAEVNAVTQARPATDVDCRTFAFDQLPFIAAAIDGHVRKGSTGDLHEVIAYSLGAHGKRVRPTLTLALAAALGLDRDRLTPIVAAGELFHTASLMFDDLPAQDDASVRRGRPTAHTVFPESSVQLAAISMISTGFGLVAELSAHFPPDRVAQVVAYVGTSLGPERLCRGQDLDLRLARSGRALSATEFVELYTLKTSAAFEAALVPLMMLTARPQREIELVGGYARHAGVVFQIRDDILDQTATVAALGKDVGQDTGRGSLVTVHGRAEAERLMAHHLERAYAALDGLPFDVALLRGMARYFATRRR
ncbi:hypothetical protein HII36_03605 [Nonomuraea sp. NN258]|uniref:polyprenyl synthetase family protein n=1 Tax=Nonomuraea antri TaxID=2730852 RepID=UPI0015699980|nr:polyprenyl synthetase family protein [Nonomuraea antri]NRQ30923.1 hypothetical protein [Nonomuraea antri]